MRSRPSVLPGCCPGAARVLPGRRRAGVGAVGKDVPVDDVRAGDEQGGATQGAPQEHEAEQAAAIQRYWESVRGRAGVGKVGVVTGTGVDAAVPPQAWSFGDNPGLADSLLAAVLAGEKTATSSSLWEYDDGLPVPQVGELSILLDGAGTPRALIRTTSVDVVPFDEVGEEFAAAEGEDDRSLASWRREHERYFGRVLERPFAADMPVVCERFELLDPRRGRRSAG